MSSARPTPLREWLENGVRMIEAKFPDGHTETVIDMNDLPQWILNLDEAICADDDVRAALLVAKTAISIAPPATAYTVAVEFLRAMGMVVPDEFSTFQLREVP